jgi:hypothetical protein
VQVFEDDYRHGVVADSLKPPGPLRYLYEYLLASCFIVPVKSEAAG